MQLFLFVNLHGKGMVPTILFLFYSFSFALDESKKETVVANALTKVEDDEKVTDTSVLTDAEDIKSKCSTNLVACHFQLSNHRQVVSLSTDLLSKEETSKNVKLLYRRGVSNLVCIIIFLYVQAIFQISWLLKVITLLFLLNFYVLKHT